VVEDGVSDGARLSMQPTRFGWAIRLGWAFATRSGDFQSQLVSLRFPLIGLACSVAILLITLSVVNGFDRALREDILSRVPHVVVTSVTQPVVASEWQSWLAEHPLVARISPHIELPALLMANANLVPVRLQGVSIKEEQSTNEIFSDIVQGSFEQIESNRFHIAISQRLAGKLGVTLGDKLSSVLPVGRTNLFSASPRQRSLEVAAIFNSRSDLDHDLVISSIETATRLGGSSAAVGVKVTLLDLFSGSNLVIAMRETGSMPPMRVDLWQHRYGSLYAAIALQKQILFLLLLVVVLLAAFNLVAHFVVSIESRSKDIAILRTMGARRQHILCLFLSQGVWHCSLAIGLGLVLGRAFLPLASRLLQKSDEVWGIPLLQEYFVHYLPYDYVALDVLLVGASSMLIGLIAHIYPAWRATTTSPSVELAHDKSQ